MNRATTTTLGGIAMVNTQHIPTARYTLTDAQVRRASILCGFDIPVDDTGYGNILQLTDDSARINGIDVPLSITFKI